jgi:hypothetical protein
LHARIQRFKEFIFHRFAAEQALEFFNRFMAAASQSQERPALLRPQQ